MPVPDLPQLSDLVSPQHHELTRQASSGCYIAAEAQSCAVRQRRLAASTVTNTESTNRTAPACLLLGALFGLALGLSHGLALLLLASQAQTAFMRCFPCNRRTLSLPMRTACHTGCVSWQLMSQARPCATGQYCRGHVSECTGCFLASLC